VPAGGLFRDWNNLSDLQEAGVAKAEQKVDIRGRPRPAPLRSRVKKPNLDVVRLHRLVVPLVTRSPGQAGR
jgi:hypothetical protein